MTFEARYPGRCDDCGGWFTEGSLIRLADHDGERRYAHETCPDDPQVSLRSAEEVCTQCWLVKPCECEES